MSFEHILFEKRGAVAWITFNHPERRNSFDHAMITEYADALERCHEDPTIGVVVVTGAGDKGFCAGGYLADLTNFSPEKGRKLFDAAVRGLTLMRRIRQPVIAAVNGAAIGGGNEVVICADLAIASEHATFGQVGPKIGSSPFFGGTNLLALTVGEKKTREIVYMCKQYTAQEALALGMVNKVVPHERLHDEVQEWCETLLDRSPAYLEMSKIGANVWFDMLMPSFELAKLAMTRMAGCDEMTEGATAFMEKRKPDFRKFRRADT
ncbi:enoyl-CoA hydratase-related protein [Aromatoleum toluclasticum]|uniref:enoyl-CoA hydratase-related protein n=1 Tax=Aromatoleum toluclasticum TaxID=92003 RepID=UPI000378A168|nr:enoyl-CoA hydratase-related protein [Aromatoleum toluclasticum]